MTTTYRGAFDPYPFKATRGVLRHDLPKGWKQEIHAGFAYKIFFQVTYTTLSVPDERETTQKAEINLNGVPAWMGDSPMLATMLCNFIDWAVTGFYGLTGALYNKDDPFDFQLDSYQIYTAQAVNKYLVLFPDLEDYSTDLFSLAAVLATVMAYT